MARLKLLEVDTDLLRDLLSLPETTTIEAVAQDKFEIHSHSILLRISDPSFPDLPPGCHIARASPRFKHHRTPNEFAGWNQ